VLSRLKSENVADHRRFFFPEDGDLLLTSDCVSLWQEIRAKHFRETLKMFGILVPMIFFPGFFHT